MEQQMDQVEGWSSRKARNQKDIELFIGQFDHGSEQYCEQKEEELREPIELMATSMTVLIDQLKQLQYEKYETNEQRTMIIKDIKKEYEEIIRQTEQIIKQQRSRYDQMMMKYDDRLKNIKQLRLVINEVWINDYAKLDQYRAKIQYYQQSQKQYRIIVDFNSYSQSFSSIDSKMEVVDMIGRFDADHRVGAIYIVLNSGDEWDDQITTNMISRYSSLYSIGIVDYNSSVDKIHRFIRQWVVQQPIIEFRLWLYGGLGGDDQDGLGLIKQYNQVIRYKQYLERLVYKQNAIGGSRYAHSNQQIQELIDQIDRL